MTRRRLRFTGLTALFLILVACVVGCGGGSGASSKTFRIGSTGAPVFESPNPFVAISVNSLAAFRYMYPFLVQYDEHLELESSFASKWTTSKDGKTWTFTTQPDAKWSDGKPLTAKDAAWTFNTMLKYKTGATAIYGPYLEGITKVTAPSDDELVVTLSKPSSTLLSNLQYLPILPQHVWASHATGSGAGLKTFAATPPTAVSGGPFELVKFESRSFALFKRNPEWWGPEPNIETWGLRQYSSPDALVQALKANEIDLALALPPTALKSVESTPGITVSQKPGLQYYDIGFNSSPNKTEGAEIGEPEVRQAIAYAINRKDLIDTFLLGAGTAGVSIVPPSDGRWYNRELKAIPYDPAHANAILDGLGYSKGPGGIRVANGHKMSYQLIYLGTENNRLVSILQANLKAIGIELVPKLVGDAAYVPAVKEGNYSKFDISMDYWNATVDPNGTLSTMTCAARNPFSETAYCSRKYDEMFRKQGTTLNLDERQAIVWKMQKLLTEERPYDVLFYPQAIEGLREGWSGLKFSGAGSFNALSDESLIDVEAK